MVRTLIRQCGRFYLKPAVVVAFRLFGPRGGFLPSDEPVLDGFIIVRGTIGVLILLVINTAYGTGLGGVTGLPLVPPSLADPESVISAPGVMLLLALAALCFTRRGYRRRAARQLVYPVQASIIFVALLAASRWIVPLASYRGTGITAVGVEPLVQLAVIWYLTLAWCATWCCAAGPFRAADGHPLLAPVAAAVFAWLAAIRTVTGVVPATMPHTLYFTVLLGGPATVTALSAFEVWLLHAKFPDRFPFREGPVPHSRAKAPWTGVPLVVFLRQQFTEFCHQVRDACQLLTFRN